MDNLLALYTNFWQGAVSSLLAERVVANVLNIIHELLIGSDDWDHDIDAAYEGSLIDIAAINDELRKRHEEQEGCEGKEFVPVTCYDVCAMIGW